MREYLDKQKLLMALNDKYHDMSAMSASYYAGFKYARRLIEIATPEKDIAPVRHGNWVYDPNAIDWGMGGWICNLCGNRNNNLPILQQDCNPYLYAGSQYCPACGAKMDLEDETDDQ